MKLFYSPGACSLADHIALEEAKLPFTLEKALKPERSAEHLAANPLGAVPTLIMDDGKVLLENAAILQWVAEQKPELNLAPKLGGWESIKFRETLNFIATEVHKSFGPLFSVDRYGFDAQAKEAFLKVAKENLNKRLAIVDKQLVGKSFIMGNQYTVADSYLFVVLGWTKHVQVSLASYPNIQSYLPRVLERPAVQKAMKAEGLL